MSDQELRNLIDNLTREINGLVLKKQKYENMNRKIDEIIGKLSDAKEYTNKSYANLKRHYISKVKSKEDSDFEGIRSLIDNQINKLKQILSASNQQICSLNSRIQTKTVERNKYLNRLNQTSTTEYSQTVRRTTRGSSGGTRNRGQIA